MTTKDIELDGSFYLGGRGRGRDMDDVGDWNGERHGQLFILGDNRDIVGHGCAKKFQTTPTPFPVISLDIRLS